MKFRKLIDQPSGNGIENLYFHKTLILTYDLIAVALAAKAEIVTSFGDLSVKGKPEIMIVLAEKGGALPY